MFFTAEVEIAVHFRTFRNISIRQPSQLTLKLTVSHDDEFVGTFQAIPISVLKCSLVGGVRNKQQLDKYNGSHIDQQANFYRSKPISIRYQDECTPLAQICVFKTRVNAYPAHKLPNKKFKLNFQLSQVKSSFSTFNDWPSDVGQFQMVVGLQPHQYFKAFFDSFSFVSSVEGVVYCQILNYRHIDNQQDIQRIICAHESKLKRQHITRASSFALPERFDSFEKFLSFVTDNYSKKAVQVFYDDYVERLRNEILKAKNTLSEYLTTLQNRQQVMMLNMSVVKKLSSCLPQPTFVQYRRSKKKIFQKGQSEGVSMYRSTLSIQQSGQIDMQSSICFGRKPKISEYSLSPQTLQQCFLSDFNKTGNVIYDIWRQFLNLMSTYPNPNFYSTLQSQYYSNQRTKYIQKNVFIEGAHIDYNNFKQNECQSKFYMACRQEITKLKGLKFKIETMTYHLVVFVHGYQAFSIDMDRILNQFKYVCPGLMYLSSSCNQDLTKDSIELMGQRLAVQIKNYLNNLTGKVSLSFVSHSMGGLIVRAALPYLGLYKTACVNFISYMFHSSSLIKTGLWVMNRTQKCTSLVQLCCEDVNLSNKKCFLQTLSQADGLQWFQNVVLIASKQDEYVSYESSRIELNPKFSLTSNDNQSVVYRRIFNNLQSKLRQSRVTRIRIEFQQQQSNFNSFIGRTAHIQMLTSQPTLHCLVCLLSPLFVAV